MTEVHRYKAVTMISAAGATIGYDPHGPDVVMAAEFDRVTAERDALQLLLNERDERLHSLEQSRRAEFDNGRAAEQRNEELSGMLQHLVDNPYRFTDAYRARIAAVLNPEPEVDNQRTIDALKEAGFIGLKT
jgi:hypothetical protein